VYLGKGALKQKDVKQMGVEQGPRVFVKRS